MTPDCSSLTRTPERAYSREALRVRPRRPCLAAECEARVGCPRSAWTLETLTMAPAAAASMGGISARIP